MAENEMLNTSKRKVGVRGEEGKLRAEISEFLLWASDKFEDSEVPVDKIEQLKKGFRTELRKLMHGKITPEIEQKVRIRLAVYKITVENLIK